MTREHGVTLIELMVTIAIVAVVLAVGVPNFRILLVGNRLAGVTNEFMGTLNYARSEAVKRGTTVSVCASSDGTACTGAWSDGWLVFVNNDNDNPAAVDAGEPPLRASAAPGGTYTIVSDNFASFITFGRNGTANTAGNFVFCSDSDESRAQAIAVTLIRPRIAADADRDGIPELDSGTEITSCETP